jgi:hypothetical protein
MTNQQRDTIREALRRARTFIQYARYELEPGESQVGDQFPRQGCADKEIARLSAALAELDAPETQAMADHYYPCAKCGKIRTADQGGRIFTVCDECWPQLNTNSLETVLACIVCGGDRTVLGPYGESLESCPTCSPVSPPASPEGQCRFCGGTGKAIKVDALEVKDGKLVSVNPREADCICCDGTGFATPDASPEGERVHSDGIVKGAGEGDAGECECRKLRDAMEAIDATLCDCRYGSERPLVGECNCDIHAAHRIARAALSTPCKPDARDELIREAVEALARFVTSTPTFEYERCREGALGAWFAASDFVLGAAVHKKLVEHLEAGRGKRTHD